MQTKARIAIGANSIEVEGTEEFVSKTLAEFREFVVAKKLSEPTPDAPLVDAAKSPKTKSKTPKVVSKAPKSTAVEKFDIHKTAEHASLADFLAEKNPGTSANMRIIVIGYFINRILSQPKFTEGHIDYAYRALQLTGRPNHLRQILTNEKNTKDWFDKDENGSWHLTRTGEIFVEEKLPPKAEK
jgi:hypothetical protein